MSSDLERTFETRWRQIGGPPLESEVRFHPTRKWRFDFAYRDRTGKLVAGFELDGGTWGRVPGRHTRGAGFAGDCEKINHAQLMGIRVFRFTADMLASDPRKHLEPIRDLLIGS